jgi:hypothetical protein
MRSRWKLFVPVLAVCLLAWLAPPASASYTCGGYTKETQTYGHSTGTGSTSFIFSSGHYLLSGWDVDNATSTSSATVAVTNAYQYFGSDLYVYVVWYDVIYPSTVQYGYYNVTWC